MSDHSKATKGVVCGACGASSWRVTATRPTGHGTVCRTRVCQACGAKVQTEEKPALTGAAAPSGIRT